MQTQAASFPGLSHFALWFALTIIHGSGRAGFHCSSASMYYCQCKPKRKKKWDRPGNKANVNLLLPKTNLWPPGPDYLTDNPGIMVMHYNYILSCHGNLVVKDYGCKENITYTWVHGGVSGCHRVNFLMCSLKKCYN